MNNILKILVFLLVIFLSNCSKHEAEINQGQEKLKTASFIGISSNEQKYWSTVKDHISTNWLLPDIREWDETLKATIRIRVLSNGAIESIDFDKKSSDHLFNQFALKAIKDSNPLPKFPDRLKKNDLEIIISLKPNNIK